MLTFEKASTTIARWWRQIRSSGRFIHFNPHGNHSADFKTFLHHQRVPKRLSYFSDLALQQALENGRWHEPRFREDHTHYSALNVFAAGKMTWEQKATLSDIVESTQTYGDFVAYPILDKHGKQTPEAKKYLNPFLHKGKQQIKLTAEEKNAFFQAIKSLPKSEQFIFVFNKQKLNNQGSTPSEHNEIRDELTESYPFIRLLDKHSLFPKSEDADSFPINGIYHGITSATHPHRLSYHGILKLSFGVENILGVICYGKDNWVKLVPQLGPQTIDDIDSFGQQWQRPTQSGDSRLLGLTARAEVVHDVKVAYTEVVAHDDFHRKYMAMLGRNIGLGISRIIELARECFQIRWSKDLWLLRDFIFFKAINVAIPKADSTEAYVTQLFSFCLVTPYQESQIENCDSDIFNTLVDKPLLHDRSGFPNYIAIVFILDLVLHPEIWRQFNISDNETYFYKLYPLFIKMAKYLKVLSVFDHDMKNNAIKFDCLMRKLDYSAIDFENENYLENLDFDAWISDKIDDLKHIDCTQYESYRNNKQVFLGFRKKPKVRSFFSLYADETLDPEPIIPKKKNKQ